MEVNMNLSSTFPQYFYDSDQDPRFLSQDPRTLRDVQSLPVGAVVGDTAGGMSFPSDIAAALEARSDAGWVRRCYNMTWWTLIQITK